MLIGHLPPGASAAPPARSTPAAAAVQTYFSLPSEQAAGWAGELIGDRLHNASRVVLRGDDWDEHLVFERELLERIGQGRRFTRRGAARLVSLTEEREAAAAAKLARDFRLTTYEAFRTDRPEFDRRMKALKKVVAAWQASGARPADRPYLITWLQSATDRIDRDRLALLPPIPPFGNDARLAQSPRIPRAAHRSDASLPLAAAPSDESRASRQRMALQPPPAAVITRALGEAPPRPAPPAATLPSRATNDDEDLALPSLGANQSLRRRAAPVDLASNSHSLAAAIPVIPADGQPPAAAREGSELLVYASQSDADVAEINLVELAARITGFNRSTTALANQLRSTPDPSVPQLATAVDQLSELATTRSDLALYCNLLGDRERQEVGAPVPLETTVTIIAAQVSRLRESAATNSDRNTGASLDQLSQRLALLAVTLRPVR